MNRDTRFSVLLRIDSALARTERGEVRITRITPSLCPELTNVHNAFSFEMMEQKERTRKENKKKTRQTEQE